MSRRRTFGQTWWSERWLMSLEAITDEGRLARGRTYARNGSVLSIVETEDGIVARVRGSHPTPYTVRLSLPPLSDELWARLLAVLRERASFSARLLNDQMPQDIEEAFDQAGVSLFPESDYDLSTDCTCWDWANPCKHVAAVYYVLSMRFDEDPFLLFRLRGRTKEQVLAAVLGDARPDEAIGEDPERRFAPPPDVTSPDFWRPARPLAGVAVSIRPPVARLPVLRRLGEPPFSAPVKLADRLGPQLDTVSQAALAAAYRETRVAADGEDDAAK